MFVVFIIVCKEHFALDFGAWHTHSIIALALSNYNIIIIGILCYTSRNQSSGGI